MKKLVCVLLILLLMVSLAAPVKAASTEYEIPEFDLTLSIPDGYDVFTRNIRANDPLLAEYGLTRDDVMDILGDNVYLDAMELQGNDEIVVTLFEDMGLDFSGLGDTALLLLASGLQESYEESGVTVFSTEVYHHPKLNFMCLYFYIPENNAYGLQYYTIYDGNALSVTLRSYFGAISDAQEKKIQSVVDSITIPSYTPEQPQTEETPAFLYTDQETGTTFTVPAGWTERGLSKEREYLDVIFSFAADPGLQIMYGSKDLSSELSFWDRLFVNQDDLYEEYCALLAEEMGISESSVRAKTYNGKKYFIVEAPYSSDEYGMKLTVTVTQAMHIEGGWVYLFQFMGDQSNPFYEEFEKVLESVEYGNVGPRSGNAQVIAITLVALMVALILLAIVISTRKQKKEAGDMDVPQYVYCPSCGKRMPDDSWFCDSCGARLTKRRREQ